MPIFSKPKTGISLVELVVVVALLGIVSLAAVQLLNMTEKTIIGSQTKLNQQLRSKSISSYCGYYVEFEKLEGENPVKFAHQITLDMGRFREFCQSSGATGG